MNLFNFMGLFLAFIFFTVTPVCMMIRPWVSGELTNWHEKSAFTFMAFLAFFMGICFWGMLYKPLGMFLGVPGGIWS